MSACRKSSETNDSTAKRGFGEEVWCGGLAAGRAMRGKVAESTGGNTQEFGA